MRGSWISCGARNSSPSARGSAPAWPPGVATREELLACLEHLLATRRQRQPHDQASCATHSCDHAAGNYRILIGMAAELLMSAAQREITDLDEKLYLQVYGKPETHTSRRAAAAR